MKFLKNLFALLFGNIGLLIIGILTAIANFIIFPMFVDLLNVDNIFVPLIAFFVGVFAIGFMVSTLSTGISLIVSGASKKIGEKRGVTTKFAKWFWIISGIILILADVGALIYGLAV